MNQSNQPATKLDISLIRQDIKGINKRFDDNVSQIRQDMKGINKRFDDAEDNFIKWKSEIHDLIDIGFTSKAKILNEEVGVLNSRTADLRHRTEILEKTVLTQ